VLYTHVDKGIHLNVPTRAYVDVHVGARVHEGRHSTTQYAAQKQARLLYMYTYINVYINTYLYISVYICVYIYM